MRWVIASLYVAAGFVHLAEPRKVLLIVPDWVPMAGQVVLATGIFELMVSVALLKGPFRQWAGWAMAAYALCVWPANFKHAFEAIQIPNFPDSWFYHGPRLLLQPVIMWWALYASEAIDWPWGRMPAMTGASRSEQAEERPSARLVHHAVRMERAGVADSRGTKPVSSPSTRSEGVDPPAPERIAPPKQ